jgi:hypothetical protein
MGALVVQLPRDCGVSRIPAAPESVATGGLGALEHPDAAEINAKMIIVQTMDGRRDIT